MKMIYLTLSIILLFGANVSEGRGVNKHCFKKHIVDAMKLNNERLPRYSILTDGKSEKLSRGLINFEKLILVFARVLDKRAIKHQSRGFNVLCSDFIDMDETPVFKPITTQIPIRFSNVPEVNISKMKKTLRKSYKKGGWKNLSLTVENEIEKISKYPSYLCLLRHFLESINRTAVLSSRWEREARDLGIKSPTRLQWYSTKLQIIGLKKAYKLDVAAAEFQEKRIPIFCQDVPKIDIPH